MLTEEEYAARTDEVLEAFRTGDEGYDALMDEMTVECDEEQWDSLVDRLDGERERFKGAQET